MLSRKKIAWILGFVCIAVVVVYVWLFIFGTMGGSCARTDISTTPSTDGKKQVITFLYNCGPTVGISIHASVVGADDEIDRNANGNALRIDSNQGQAWPRDEQGRPIIRAEWNSPTAVTLYYSSNAEVFYQKAEADGVKVTIAPLTQ